MTDRSKLLALAEAVEKLTGPDWVTDAAIWLHLPEQEGHSWKHDGDRMAHAKHIAGCSFIPSYTASLDAAMTLVPEGLVMALVNAGTDDPVEPDFTTVSALVCDWRAASGQPVIAATMPIALTAACLRARAQAEALA